MGAIEEQTENESPEIQNFNVPLEVVQRMVVQKKKNIINQTLSSGEIKVKAKHGLLDKFSFHKSQIQAQNFLKEKLDEAYDDINIFEDKAFCKELEILRQNIKPELKFVLNGIKDFKEE